MKKGWIAIVLTISVTSPIRAAVRPFVGLGVGRSSANQATYSAFQSGLVAGLERNSLGLEVGVSHLHQATKYAEGMRAGTLTLIPISVNFKVSPRISRSWWVIGKGGFSYVMTDRELGAEEIMVAGWNGWKVSEEVREGWGGQFGGGLEYKASKHMAVSVEIMQNLFNSEVVYTRKDSKILTDNVYTEIKRVDLSGILGQIVVKWCF